MKQKKIKAWAVVYDNNSIYKHSYKYINSRLEIYTLKRDAEENHWKFGWERKVAPCEITLLFPKPKIKKVN